MEDRDVYVEEPIRCPVCGKRLDVLRFGLGWIAACHNKIVYNSTTNPYQESRAKEKQE